MKYNLKPVVQKVVNLLSKEGFFVDRMRGDHIIINKMPSLRRPIVLVNVKKPSNVVRQNLLSACHEAGVRQEIIQELNELLRY
jgi:predicted RNA binding protein YcfA (HicA-like mRNA interferase family)